MKYTALGETGMKVSNISYGKLLLALPYYPGADPGTLSNLPMLRLLLIS